MSHSQMTPPSPAPTDAIRAQRAMIGTYVAFIAAGVGIASWASRIPQVRDGLGLSEKGLGFVLLSIAVGSLCALPLSGPIAARIGGRRMVEIGVCVLATGLTIAAVGYRIGVLPVVVGLFLFGFSAGTWDVGMNLQAALVEQAIGRSIMSRFHAGFSVGTVAAALVGAGMAALKIDVTVHLIAVAVVVLVAVLSTTRWFLPEPATATEAESTRGGFAAWREPRTLMIGLMVLAFTFAEGTATDWIGVAIVDAHDASKAVGTLVFAVFLAAMTTGRWFGPAALDRYGRQPVVRLLAAIGVAGTLLFIVAPSPWIAAGGAALWGIGASLGFPVGMSAAADESQFAAGRVSVVASIGYCAFLTGPPVIGLIGESVTVIKALFVVSAMLVVAGLLSPAVRQRAHAPSEVPTV